MGDAAAENQALAEVIRTVTDLWTEPLDEVHDVPPIVNAVLASGYQRTTCACTAGPGYDGPVEECPRHGRPYDDWVQACVTAQISEAALRTRIEAAIGQHSFGASIPGERERNPNHNGAHDVIRVDVVRAALAADISGPTMMPRPEPEPGQAVLAVPGGGWLVGPAVLLDQVSFAEDPAPPVGRSAGVDTAQAEMVARAIEGQFIDINAIDPWTEQGRKDAALVRSLAHPGAGSPASSVGG